MLTQKIDHPSAWKSAEIGGKEGFIHRIGPEHRAAFDELLARTRHLPTLEITREHFDHPLINDLMLAVRDVVMNGRGAIVLSGLDMSRTRLEDFERIYWGIGTHLGHAVAQSAKGDRVGRVEKVEDDPTGRGYQGDMELRAHSDFHELLGLACFRKASAGGESGLVSAVTLHNLLLEERPELLPPLYEGFYHASSASSELSAQKVPIFAFRDGKLSCHYHGLFMNFAAAKLGVEIPSDLREALDYMIDLANDRPEVRADFMLEPGEILIWHNFTQLHSRKSFTNEGEDRRLLLRLWLNVPDGRPMPEVFRERARFMDRLHESGKAAIDYATNQPPASPSG